MNSAPDEVAAPYSLRCAMVTLDERASRPLVQAISRGVALDEVLRWGDCGGYLRLRQGGPALILFDAGAQSQHHSLARHVQALHTLTAVAVLTHHEVNVAALIEAGAEDVLSRDAAPIELCARVRAHARRLARYRPAQQSQIGLLDPAPARPCQRFLLDWLLSETEFAATPFDGFLAGPTVR